MGPAWPLDWPSYRPRYVSGLFLSFLQPCSVLIVECYRLASIEGLFIWKANWEKSVEDAKTRNAAA